VLLFAAQLAFEAAKNRSEELVAAQAVEIDPAQARLDLVDVLGHGHLASSFIRVLPVAVVQAG
jgi:hypothetical protein